MTSFNDCPPSEPHQALARAVARKWQLQHPLRAAVVMALARLGRGRQQPSCHPLEWCPATPQDDLDALLEQWCCHWLVSLASTPEGRLQLELRDQANDARLDREGW